MWFTVLIILLSPFIWWYFHVKKHAVILDNIPGPKPLPLIGNVLELGSSPQEFLNTMIRYQKKYGSVFRIMVGPTVQIILVRPEMVEPLLSSNILLTKSATYDKLKLWLGDGLLISDGDKWRSRRKMITPSFHFKILDQFLQIFNLNAQIMVEKLDSFIGQPSVDILPFINLCSLDNICETSMGIKINALKDENDTYVTAVREFLNIFIFRAFSFWKQYDCLFRFSSDYKLNTGYIKTLHAFTRDIIKTKREERAKSQPQAKDPTSDDGIKQRFTLIDMLLNSEESQKLDNEDIRAEIDTFLFEGHDTTTSAMAFTCLALADNQSVQQKCYEEIVAIIGEKGEGDMQQYQEMKYLDKTIKEVLRMYPSVPYIERKLPQSATLDGQFFPKGSIIGIFAYGLNHSTDIFENPERFDPERFTAENQSQRHNYGYVPFSAGPRNCIGQRFAILEIKAIISKILQNYHILQVPNFKPDLGLAAILKSYNGVMIKLEKRK